MTNQEAHQLAERFWARVGRREPFPRSLEIAVYEAIDTLVVVRLPHLVLDNVRDYFSRCNIGFDLTTQNRELRAFLLAQAGWGFVFLDGADPECEQRYSFAHEFAHFLLDHLWPREEAIERLGPTVRDVLDGLRAPSVNERMDAVLKRVRLGTYTHIIDRSPNLTIDSAIALGVEDWADRLALELLAPRSDVVRRLTCSGVSWRNEEAFAVATTELTSVFGLPAETARRYGEMIVRGKRGTRSFREWLQ